MKKLVQFIKEAFSSTYLQDIDAMFKEANKRYEELYKDQTYKPYRSGETSFKRVINSNWITHLRYDKIKDENFKEYAPDDVIMSRIIRKLIKGTNYGIAIGYKNNFPYTLLLNSNLFILPKVESDYADYLSAQSKNIRQQYTVIDLFKSCELVRICQVDFDRNGIAKNNKEIYIDRKDPDSNASRQQSRDGMIFQGDDNFYRDLAERNIKRYKEEIAKKEANKLDDEEIYDKITDIVNGLAKINERYFSLSEEEMTNNKYNYQRIIANINGANGVMPTFWEYKWNKDQSKRTGSSWNKDSMNRYRKQLLTVIDKALNDIQALPF